MQEILEKKFNQENYLFKRKEYAFYDFLNHLFTLKYYFHDYVVLNDTLKMNIKYSVFKKYCESVKKELYSLKVYSDEQIKVGDKVYYYKDNIIIDKYFKYQLMNKIADYCLYDIIENKDYKIVLEQYKDLYHPYDIKKLTLREQNAFYGKKAQRSLNLIK